MQSLDEKTWEVFQLEDEFECAKGIYLPTGDVTDGNDPFITAKSGNNGLARFIGNGTLFGGNRITIEKIRLSAYYQSAPFYCSHDVSVISNNNLDANNSQFIAEMIMRNGSKYSYGRQAQLNVVKRERIMLPITDSGEPDYEYMAEYAQQKRDAMLAKYRAYAKARIAELGKAVKIPALDEKEWKPIFISDMFEFVRGCENNMAVLEDGDLPLISAKANNNGLKGFVHSPKKVIAGRCITLNNDGDGGAGLAYYQPANMALDTHVTALMPRFDMSMFVMLFIAECISGLHGFFGHGLSISNPRAKRIRIMLPVNNSGEPDYEYMEQYAKNTMLRKYQQYLTFLQQHSDTDK